jgi:hypothetical protein
MFKNAQIFQYKVLQLKHYASNMFRSVTDNLQGEFTAIMYKTRIKIILA